jgi:N-acetylmuramate 1-kinase
MTAPAAEPAAADPLAPPLRAEASAAEPSGASSRLPDVAPSPHADKTALRSAGPAPASGEENTLRRDDGDPRPRDRGDALLRDRRDALPRDAAIRTFLSAAGWPGAARAPLAGDASPRRYERVTLGPRRAVLMDAAPGPDAEPWPFLAVTAWLRAAGFSAPEVLCAEAEAGLILLEDLGDALYARILAEAGTDADEHALYAAAVDLLAALHAMPPPAGDARWRPGRYDVAAYLREARLAVDWYLPAATGAPVPAEEAAAFDAIIAELTAPLAGAAPVAVLRDYHAENLLWLPNRAGHARVGLLDYQDLLLGHPAYDLVSLLEDARRDTTPELRAAMTARYCAATGADPEAFAAAAAILAAQRNLKILGIFARLCRRDGKPGYLRHLPRVWDHLQRDLAHPALAPLRAWCAGLPAPDAATRARIERPA